MSTHDRIDLNNASADRLTDIPGVGPTMAERLVEARTEAPFRDWEDLERVRGIGGAKVAEIRPGARLGEPTGAETADVGHFDALLVREFLREPELVEWFGIDASLERTADAFDRDDARTFLDRLADELRATDWASALDERRVAAESDESRYQTACWKAICHGLLGDDEAAFHALRTAAAIDDDWARHHHIYGLLHGARQKTDDARFELGMALAEEPYPEARRRIEDAATRC